MEEIKKSNWGPKRKRMKIYQDSQRIVLLAEDGRCSFFKNAKAYMTKEKPKLFDVCVLFPGKSEAEVSELLAGHFNAISSEFEPLETCDIPVTFPKVPTHSRTLPGSRANSGLQKA